MTRKRDVTLPMAAESILPHRPPMLLIERLVARSERSATAEACLPASSVFADQEGRLDPVVLVELLAQTFAALQGYDDIVGGRPVREGFLVGVRQVRVFAPAWTGELLRIAVNAVGRFEGFALVEGEVLRGGELLAAGTIKLWVRETATGEGPGG